jgi:hypothetical protein
MFKPLLATFLLLLCIQLSNAQIKQVNWIKTKVTYSDNTELEDINSMKYGYLRYNFQDPGKVRISTFYTNKGASCLYSILNNHLFVKSDLGIILNEFLIERADNSSLILLQKGAFEFNGDDCLRFYFIPEPDYQSSFNPSSADVLSAGNSDTVYFSNEKLYPNYKGQQDYFYVLKSGVGDQGSRDLYFLATYVVRKDGHADNLKILESFSPSFDEKIIKNFKKSSKNWLPATLHGKAVSVQMKQEYQYSSIGTTMPAYAYKVKAAACMAEKDYETALLYLDAGIEKASNSKEMLYARAVCKHEMGNLDDALLDLQILERLGDRSAAELRKQWLSGK